MSRKQRRLKVYKALAKGFVSYLKGLKESTAKVGDAVLHGAPDQVAPKVADDVMGKAVADALEGADFSTIAKYAFKSSALENPKFQFKTKYEPIARKAEKEATVLKMTLEDAREGADNYEPDASALAKISELSAKRKEIKAKMVDTEDENALIAFQKQVDDIGYEIRDLKKGDIQFPKEVVDELKAQSAILGIQPDVFEGLLKAHKFGEIGTMFHKAAEERSYIECANAMRDLCVERHIPRAQIDAVFNDTQLSWSFKGAKLTQMADAAGKVMEDALEKSGKKIDLAGLGTVDKWLTGVEVKAGHAITYFNQKGMLLASNAMRGFSAVARVGGVAKSKLQQLYRDIELRDIALGDQRKNAVREYMEKRDYSKAVMYSDHPTKKMIMANPEMAQAVAEKYGIKFGYAEMKYANQKESILRETKKYDYMMKSGAYDQATRELPRSINEIDGTVIRYANQRFGTADLGPNYHPRKGNDEWLERTGKKFPEDMESYRDAVKNGDLGNQLKFFERRRNDSPDLELNENRLSPEEEIKFYMSGLADASIRREGVRFIQQAKFATLMPLGEMKGKNMKGEHQYLQLIEKNWQMNFNPKGLEGLSAPTKWLLAYSKAVIPLALMSEKMIVSNSWQAIFTGGYRHGYLKAIAATGLEITKFGKEIIFHPTRFKSIFDSMAKGDFDKAILTGDKGMRARNLYRYQQNNVGLHTMVDEDFKSIMAYSGEGAGAVLARAFAWLGETITLPFAYSDQISRRAAFTSAHWHGEYALKTFQKNLKKGMSIDEAKTKLVQDLHLKSFNLGDDPDYIMKALDIDNIKGSAEEFLFRYADRSMRQEIFDYSTLGQSMAKAKAKEIHPIAGVALTFTSWPMYFHELSKGALQAYKNGDKEPLLKLIAGGLAVYMGSTAAMGEDSVFQKNLKPYMDKGGIKGYLAKTASEMPNYMQARAPGLSYYAFVEKLTASPAGILTPLVGVVTYPIVASMDSFSDMLSGGAQNSFDFFKMTAKKYANNEIAWRRGLYLSKVFKQVGILDRDLKEYLDEKLED